jgi:Vitamin B6 photo-protection and homoeostasis
MSTIEIRETDEVGRPTATYLVSSTEDNASRVDIVPATNNLPLSQRLLTIFLPNGYPHTVSPDYTSYQIYDSMQAFFSAIAGLLASRAVLQGLGVGDENASATAAMLLSIAQESLGRFATIFFAHWASKRIESDCKMYRFLADIVNDCAFIMDCLSPSLPTPLRIPLLCVASGCRAICGVAGGSSKAILSAHFARANNIGELNAKDSSQETVISLLGMWAGGFVVSNVHGKYGTWTWLLVLVVLHLTTNYLAVCSVSMKVLNRQRANLVFSSMSVLNSQEIGSTVTPQEIGKQEAIFAAGNALMLQNTCVGVCRFGTLEDMMKSLDSRVNRKSGSLTESSGLLPTILDIFSNEGYILWFTPRRREAIIVLKTGSTAKVELYAWWHAMRVAVAFAAAEHAKDLRLRSMLLLLKSSLLKKSSQEQQMKILENAGWDLSTVLLQTSPTKRIHLVAAASAEGVKQGPIG